MGERTSVVNISGDHEETIVQLAKHLGTDKIRRRVFEAVYGRGTLPKSKKQIMALAGIKAAGTRAQQVQNQLDHLAKHHLVVRSENNGSVPDGSRYLYQKDPTVRANKERIIRLADNRKAAQQVPTKRRPLVRGMATIKAPTLRALKKRTRLSVLYLTANPIRKHSLRLDAEMRRVQEAIRGSIYRDNVEIFYKPAADLDGLIDGLNDHRPQIVHFSGHGNAKGLATDKGKVSPRNNASNLSFGLLAKALAATDHPPVVVVLNSCKSAAAQTALLKTAQVVIGMRDTVSDVAAAAFAVKFFAGIAGGQSIQSAYEQGKIAVEAVSLGEADNPEISHAVGINPRKIILA